MRHFRPIFFYFVLPFGLVLALVLMYFEGPLVLQRIVVPKLPPMPMDSWREFGLLESLQHLGLIAIAVIAALVAKRAPLRAARVWWACIALASVFVLLEEIDYGSHLVDYWQVRDEVTWFVPADAWPDDVRAAILTAEPFNLHNQGDLTDLTKAASMLVLLGLFVVAPLSVRRSSRPWLRRLAPSRYSLLTVAAMGLIHLIAHSLAGAEQEAMQAAVAQGLPVREPGAIGKNVSEFRELMLYYLFLIYAWDAVLAPRRPLEAAAASESASGLSGKG